MSAFKLYGRAWCHLCEDLRAGLEPIAAEFGVPIEWIDIDADLALEAVIRRTRARSGAGWRGVMSITDWMKRVCAARF